MATHGDAGWIAASLENLLPPNLKQRAGFARKVEAAIQVSEVVCCRSCPEGRDSAPRQ